MPYSDIANLPCAFGHIADTRIFQVAVQGPKYLILLVGAQGLEPLDPLIKSQLLSIKSAPWPLRAGTQTEISAPLYILGFWPVHSWAVGPSGSLGSPNKFLRWALLRATRNLDHARMKRTARD